MSAPHDDPREELAAIAADLRDHLEWMRDAGIRQVKRETFAPVAFAAPGARPVGQSVPAEGRWSPPGTTPRPAAPVPPRPAPVPVPVAAPVTPPPMPVAAVVRPVAPAPVPVPVAVPVAAAPMDRASKLRVIRAELGDCRRCKLHTTRTNLVFGQGNPEAELVFVGEGPGEDEDLSGQAFVGRAGDLLTKMILAMGFTRDQVYICNIVKCRPPGNRKPEPDEVEKCRPFVEQQLLAIRPRVIVALGATATQNLLRVDTAIGRLRGEFQQWQGIPVMPTFHPSYLLRTPGEKGKAWDDLKKVVTKLGRTLPARQG